MLQSTLCSLQGLLFAAQRGVLNIFAWSLITFTQLETRIAILQSFVLEQI